MTSVVGENILVPLLNGKRQRYINFDNAASTPLLQTVWDDVSRFVEWYSSIHRGAGFKSQVSTHAYEQSRVRLCRFVGGDESERVVIFVKQTTEAVNKLAARYPFEKGDVLITTLMEHHANDLPWRNKVEIVRLLGGANAPFAPSHLEEALKNAAGRCRLVAVTGASNVTGIINPIYDLAEVAHRYGAEIFVDAAQLAPHRAIHMGRRGDPRAIDYLALSGHKMYAPLGAGALIGWPEIFNQGIPDQVGGGTVLLVNEDEVLWKDAPERDEAGSPNVVGAVAMALSATALQKFGMAALAEHEAVLAKRVVEGLHEIPGVIFVGPDTYDIENRVGVIAFNVDGVHHSKIAAILGNEFGIGVRNGCFCAHPYLKHLLGFSEETSHELSQKIRNGEPVELPGAVRISFGIYNTIDEVEVFLAAMRKIVAGEYEGTYVVENNHGDYVLEGFSPSYADYFTF